MLLPFLLTIKQKTASIYSPTQKSYHAQPTTTSHTPNYKVSYPRALILTPDTLNLTQAAKPPNPRIPFNAQSRRARRNAKTIQKAKETREVLETRDIHSTVTTLNPMNGQVPEEQLSFEPVEGAGFKKKEDKVVISITYPVGSGFVNIGTSCYINSVLQVIVHLKPISQEMDRMEEHSKCKCILTVTGKWCSLCALASLITRRNEGVLTKHSNVPWCFIQNFKEFAPHLSPNREEDAHEFLISLLTAFQNHEMGLAALTVETPLQEECDRTWVSRIFEGSLRHTVFCEGCGNSTLKFERFWNVGVKLAAPTVAMAMDGLVEEERLEDDSKYHCQECRRLQNAVRRTELFSPPRVLIVNLGRFSAYSTKLRTFIKASPTLNLVPTSTGKEIHYQLQAIICHAGESVKRGHYYAHVKGRDNKWYKTDDSRVMCVSETRVLHDPKSYLLFYSFETFEMYI